MTVYGGGGGVEVLVLQLTDSSAIHGIGKVCTEALHVEERSPSADLLIGGKADPDLPMGDLGMGGEIVR